MAHTAPPGYRSNYDAILDLIRFGPSIWSCAQFQALLFHAERSTAYGKDADKHSEKQAVEGIYSSQTLEWVRGPAGVARCSWYRANRELVIDPEDPIKTPDGVIHRCRGEGKHDVTEYQIDWLAVKRRIARWKESQGSQFETPETESRGLNFRPGGSQFETPDGKFRR